MAEYISVAQAKKQSSMRIVAAAGIPGPWAEAVKGFCYVKKIPYSVVQFDIGAENADLVAWSAQASAPVMIWNDEFPKSVWSQQLALTERIQPNPGLIPTGLEDRLLLFGYANELCGENGLGWCRRLMVVSQFLNAPDLPEESRAFGQYFGGKYGYSPEAGEAAPGRAAQILESLGKRLESQKAAGSQYFIGESLTALDIYWAAFATLIQPLPEEICPMGDANRFLYTNTDATVQAAVNPLLIEHRDFIYNEYLELPVDL
jgi:glutathione S-transferase